MLSFFVAMLFPGANGRRSAAKQVGKYMIGGAIYFWSAYAVFAALYSGAHWHWFPAKICSDIVGWTLNYFVQRHWTFKEQAHFSEMEHAGRYVFIEAVGFVLDYAIVGGLNAIGITPYIGFFLSSIFFSVWSWLWYKHWVFPEEKKIRTDSTPRI